MSVHWPIIRSCLTHLRKTAVIDDRGEHSYGKLLAASFFVADRIDAATGRQNVAIMLPTSAATPIALLATWLCKRTPVPLNYLLKPEELAYVIRDCEADTIITAQPMIDFLGGDEALDKLVPSDVNILKLEDTDFTGLPPLRWPPLSSDDDNAVILYTSGTSGRPKGVQLTHKNIKCNVQDAIAHAKLTGRDTVLGVLPQFHSFGLTVLTVLPLMIGAKVVYSARFVPRKIVELIRDHKPKLFVAVPSMYGAMLSVKKVDPADFASVSLPVSGGEPLPDAVYENVKEKFGMDILEGYGLTETSPASHWSTPWDRKRHSVGKPLPRVKHLIVDDHDKPLPTGESGEILLAGPNIMKGYFKLPEETSKVFVEINGTRWFRTGDIGKTDKDNFLFITGRKKEMLIIGGENVFPREIEEVLNKHKTVAASAVIGKQDDARGEVAIAFVELNEDAEFDEAELRNWCRESLAQYKVPREIRVVEQLPRNPTGKIMRRELSAD